MAADNWLTRLAGISKKVPGETEEVKDLRNQLDNVVGEFRDRDSYDVKFMDVEPSNWNTHFFADFNAIDQQIDAAALARVYTTETWVYAGVTAIVRTIAALPTKLEKRTTIKKKVQNDITGEMDSIEEEVWIDASGEKLNKLFRKPNPYSSKTEFINLILIDLLTSGEYYIYLDSDVDLTTIATPIQDDDDEAGPWGRLRAILAAKDCIIKGMYRLPPSMMKPIPSKDRVHIEGYFMFSDRGNYAFSSAEIIHVKLPNPVDPFRGLSPLVAAFKPVLLDRFSTEHMVRFYKAGARLGGVITTEKPLNKEQLGRFQRSFENNYTGRANHHRTLILPPGMQYKTIEQNPAETALLDFCRYNREAILSAYGVPPIKVGILDKANYANARVQLKMFFQDSIMPLLTFVEDGFNNHAALMPDSHTYRIKFDVSGVEALQEDYAEKAEAAKAMLDGGLTFDEVRKEVWKKPALAKDGDMLKLQLEIELKKGSSGGLMGSPAALASLSAPESTTQKDALPSEQPAQNQISGTKPTRGTFTERVQELVAFFMTNGYPLAQAIQLAHDQAYAEGFRDDEPPRDPSKPPANEAAEAAANETPKDAAPAGIGTAQNSQIIQHLVGGAVVKPPRLDSDEDEEDAREHKGDVPTLAEFIAENLAKLDPGEKPDAQLIQELTEIYAQTYSGSEGKTLVENKETEVATTTADSAPTSAPSQTEIQENQKEEKYASGHSKAQIVEHWKGFLEKTEPMIEKRQAAVKKFFEKFKRVVMNRFGGNLKSYGMHKARDNKDVEDILKLDAFDKVLQEYIDEIDSTLGEAFKFGFDDTLVNFKFGTPSEAAAEFLKKYAAKEVTYITDTTRDQMKELLTTAFEEGVDVGEVGRRIQDKFSEISEGRAKTIARTETLSAVSAGRAEKRTQWQQEFPDKQLKKMWVSAQDEKVRDSHQEVDGEVVDADEFFSNGLAYPRMFGGEPEEIINCRCTDITFPADDEAAVQDALPSDEEPTDEEVTSDEEKSADSPESEAGAKGGPGV